MPTSLTFCRLSSGSPFLDTVAQWIYMEWSNETGDSISVIKSKLIEAQDAPPSVVAVLADQPIGSVWFTRFRLPEAKAASLWINGLYVDEPYRNQGFGQALVKQAETLAKAFEPKLFAYTDIPEFYLRLGWTVHTEKDARNHTVVVRIVPDS